MNDWTAAALAEWKAAAEKVDRTLPLVEISEALQLLPRADLYCVTERADRLYALAGAVVFCIAHAWFGEPDSSGTAAVVRIPVRPDKLVVGFRKDHIERSGDQETWRHHWMFRFDPFSKDEDHMVFITGRVTSDPERGVSWDGRDEFSRVLARLAGWDFPDETPGRAARRADGSSARQTRRRPKR